jgi:hypothetical protein
LGSDPALSILFFKRDEAPDEGFYFFPGSEIQPLIALDMPDDTMIDRLVWRSITGIADHKPDDERRDIGRGYRGHCKHHNKWQSPASYNLQIPCPIDGLCCFDQFLVKV